VAAAASRTTEPSTTCDARTRSGGLCKLSAGSGTDHLGAGQCRFHGGSTPNGRKHAAKLQAAELALEYDLEPHDALLWSVRLAAGEVKFFTGEVAALEEDALVVEHERQRVGDLAFTETSSRAELSIWIRARQDALERLAKYAKMAIDAGVAERHVRVAERYGELLAELVGGILRDLDLTGAQQERAPAIVRKHLQLFEGGKAEAA
jgi:hypothetical protein